MEQEMSYAAVLETVEKSTDAILDLQNESSEMVFNVQIANDMRELNRRNAEMKLKAVRTEFLEEEARKAETQLDEINSKWEGISKFNDALDIYNACETQKSKYMEVFQCKNKMIETLKNELAKADDKFVNDQKLQREDISILSSRINNQIDIMKRAYRRHLDLIEETIKHERKILLYRKHEEWISLNDEHGREQRMSLEEKFNTVEEYERSISEMMSTNYEKYRETKKKLDIEVKTLHVDFEETKSTCLLNERKLEYNYLVLSKRHEELGKIRAAQRRRINKLKDALSEIQNRKQLCEKTHLSQVAKYEKCIADLKLNLASINEKTRRTDDVNENTYRKIWKFNEKRARLFLKKVHEIDALLHEKLLRSKWCPPSTPTMKMTELPSVQFALRHLPSFHISDEDVSKTSTSDSKITNETTNSHLLRFVLHNITENIKFLISEKIESLTENLSEEKKSLVCFDNTLNILKINHENDLNILRNHFVPHIECITCKGGNRFDDEEFPSMKSRYYNSLAAKNRTGSGNCLARTSRFVKRPLSARTDSKSKIEFEKINKICENPQHTWFIDQFTVIKLLTDFIKDLKIRERKKMKSEPLQKVILSRILTSKDIELYWNKLRSNFTEDRNTFWEAILPSVTEYQFLLQENININEKVQHVLKQNNELKRALKHFSMKFTKSNEA